MKIVSRLPEEEAQLERLRNILEAATGGAIAPGGDLEPATTLTDLVGQVDITCISLLETIDVVERDNIRLGNIALSHQINYTTLRDAFASGVSYDEDLDHAATDFIESMLASNAAESTFDGEISFRPGVVMSKEDLKPMLREAINSWVRLKLQ